MSLTSALKTLFGLNQKVEVISDSNDARDNKLTNLFSSRLRAAAAVIAEINGTFFPPSLRNSKIQ